MFFRPSGAWGILHEFLTHGLEAVNNLQVTRFHSPAVDHFAGITQCY